MAGFLDTVGNVFKSTGNMLDKAAEKVVGVNDQSKQMLELLKLKSNVTDLNDKNHKEKITISQYPELESVADVISQHVNELQSTSNEPEFMNKLIQLKLIDKLYGIKNDSYSFDNLSEDVHCQMAAVLALANAVQQIAPVNFDNYAYNYALRSPSGEWIVVVRKDVNSDFIEYTGSNAYGIIQNTSLGSLVSGLYQERNQGYNPYLLVQDRAPADNNGVMIDAVAEAQKAIAAPAGTSSALTA